MPTQCNLLEQCTQASKYYHKTLASYTKLFNAFFTNELLAFGYERWFTNGNYMGASNLPEIAEIFIETEAFRDQQLITTPENMRSYCTFIYPDANNHPGHYNSFRENLLKNLNLRTSFCLIEKNLGFCEVFVWNFKSPHNQDIDTEKLSVLNDCFKKAEQIYACLQQFKKDFLSQISKEKVEGIDLTLLSPFFNKSPVENSVFHDYRQYNEMLFYSQLLENHTITTEDFSLSHKQQELLKGISKTTSSYTQKATLHEIGMHFYPLKHDIRYADRLKILKSMGMIL